MEKLRKIFVISVIFVTVMSLSVVAVPKAGATASAGDLIKMAGLSSVYYLGADGKRYVFPNEQTYFSWYSDFSSVITIPQSELESYPLGANVTMRPGTKLVKITTDPKVYAVEPKGNLLWVPSEDVANTLYGANWNKRIIDVPDAFFTNYTVEVGKQATTTAYPIGNLIKKADSSDIYYIDASGNARKITGEAALAANRFKASDVITTTLAIPAAGTNITGAETALLDTSSGAGGVAGAGTGLTVALSSNTPASQTVITSNTANQNAQAAVPFTTINFTAAPDGDVTVTNLKFKRMGISADTDLDNLYLYDGTTRLTDGSSISSNVVTFNSAAGLFTVTKGTTKSITLEGDMYYLASSGKTIGFELVAATDVTTNGAAVSGSFPMNGNLMSTANATDLGVLTFSNTDHPNAGSTSLNPGTDQEVYQFTLNSTNQELSIKRLRFTAVGSIQLTDIKNFKLFNNGVQVGATVAAMTTGNIVDLDLSASPFIVPKGGSKIMSIRADITDGSTRSFYMSLQSQQDIVVKDNSYGVYVEPYVNGTYTTVKPLSIGGVQHNYLIAAGDLSISKSTDSPTADVAVDGTNVVVGTYDFTASGEDMKVLNLDVYASTSRGALISYGLLNGKVYVNDAQVGSTKNLTGNGNVNFTFGSTFVVKAGTTAKVKIIADIKSTTSTSYSGNEQIMVEILSAAGSNVQSMTSLNTLSRPAATVNANVVSVSAAGLTVSNYSGFGNQTVVAGTSNVRLGSFIVSAGASEGVSVSSITVTLSTDEAATVTDMYLKDQATGAIVGVSKPTLSGSNVYSVNFTLTPSGAKVVDLYGSLKAGANIGPWQAGIDASGSGSVTGKSATTALTQNIQTITIGQGTLNVISGSQPASTILLAGTTGNYMAQFTFSAQSSAFTIDKLRLTVSNNFSTSTSKMTLKYKDASGAQQSVDNFFVASGANGVADFNGVAIYVPKNGNANIDVYVDTSSFSNSGVSGANSTITFVYNGNFDAKNDAGTALTSVGTTNLSGNTFYVRAAKPTFAVKAQTGSTPSSANSIFTFSVIGEGGNVGIKQLGFTLSTTTVKVTNIKLYDANGAEVTTTGGTSVDNSGNISLLVSGVDDVVLTIGSTETIYQVKGTVSGWAAGASLTTNIRADGGAVANNVANNLTAGNSIVWSDQSASAHTTATTDWTNGFLLKNLSTAWAF